MMDLEFAIQHCIEIAEQNEKTCNAKPDVNLSQYRECAEEHRQLAEWLKELKRHREAWKKIKEEVEEMSWSLEAYVPDLDVREVDLDDVLNIIDKILGEITEDE